MRQAWDAAKDAELDKESWAQICDQFDAENPHIGQAAEVAKLLRSNLNSTTLDVSQDTARHIAFELGQR